ncbi:hypothetical protein AB0L53_06615 [Nonomuraea sp. NPDC052129]|jgi:hypothetical protein|uniref:hypothetical protein n=1 Tax=unclassified Nonomuraea TaxID=2593643 RepID=UPI0034095D9D
MSSPRTSEDLTTMESAPATEADERAEHAANAQWLKDNPASMPQVAAGRWAVYNRAGHLRGHLVGDGPTRETRFKAISADKADNDRMPAGSARFGITLHDAGAHLLDGGTHGGLAEATGN